MYNATEITFTDFHALMGILYDEMFDNHKNMMNDEKQPMFHRAMCHDVCKFLNAAKSVSEIKIEHTKLLTNNNDVLLFLLIKIQKMKDINDGKWLDEILSDASDDIRMFVQELPDLRNKFIISIDKEKHSIFVLWAQE